MKWNRVTGLVSVLSLLAAGAFWAGCSGDDNKTDGGGNDSGGSDATKQDSGGNDSGGNDSGGDGGVTLSCDTYCTTIMSACTGDNQQYISKDNCLEMCAKIPVGQSSDTSGDTLGCRTYHVGVAAQSTQNAAVHCPHAGPYGYGGCGDLCPDFCARYAGQCDITTGWGGTTACPTTCATVAGSDGGAFFTDAGGVSSGNTMECRQYHLEAAYTTDGGGGHCDHSSATGGGVCQ